MPCLFKRNRQHTAPTPIPLGQCVLPLGQQDAAGPAPTSWLIHTDSIQISQGTRIRARPKQLRASGVLYCRGNVYDTQSATVRVEVTVSAELHAGKGLCSNSSPPVGPVKSQVMLGSGHFMWVTATPGHLR